MHADYLNSLYLAPRVLLERFRLADVAYKVVGIGSVGKVLARAHARTADAVVLAAYLGKSTVLDEAIRIFAYAYAEQTESDHAALQQAIKAGRLPDAAQDS
ncbi:DUF2252 family protein [Reyranella sp.]|uniref:DUF2252 family protein n=1 Tax=Reyranella sp. TaxID=1929291 RepID=UPI003D0F3B14